MIFYDLNIKVNFEKEISDIIEYLLFFKKIGYSRLGINTPLNKIEKFKKLRNKIDETELKIYSRTNIKAKKIENLKHTLRNFRRKFDLIGLDCSNINVCHWAIQDSRPDIIILNKFGLRNYNYSTAKLINHNDKAFEISIKDLLFSYPTQKSKLLRLLIKCIKYYIKADAAFLLTSNSEMGMIYDSRAPRDLISLCYLMDIPDSIAKKTVTEYPERILENALKKMDPKVLSNNIRIINEEEENSI
ncbi:MAG: hypothetical protein GF329_15740 [Candidatus Lokiarchaeota archaeon]|nr:hypothetical protein [Candidatus Lokiarchaeota archaeon]